MSLLQKLRIHSVRLARMNYSPSRGSCCPRCGHEKTNEYGSVRWYTPVEEQDFVGWAVPPWPNNFSRPGSDVAACFECRHCKKMYWFHLDKSHVGDLCEQVETKT